MLVALLIPKSGSSLRENRSRLARGLKSNRGKKSERSIRAVVKGLSGPVVVNGQPFNGVMPPVMLTDEQVAHVLTYVRNSWGNSGDIVSIDEVKRVHAESANQ